MKSVGPFYVSKSELLIVYNEYIIKQFDGGYNFCLQVELNGPLLLVSESTLQCVERRVGVV